MTSIALYIRVVCFVCTNSHLHRRGSSVSWLKLFWHGVLEKLKCQLTAISCECHIREGKREKRKADDLNEDLRKPSSILDDCMTKKKISVQCVG